MLFVREHLVQLNSVPNDTLNKALSFLASENEFHFDNSK